MSRPPDDFAAIPMLMEAVREPVPESPPVVPQQATAAPRRPAGREAQQSLFDDLPVVPPSTPAPRAKKLPPTLQRLAEDLLRARAPKIIDELADEHARRLSTELRARLRSELAGLLADLSVQDPPAPGDGDD